ncbi:hypothetical protein MPDQ_008100 [Monascus purpureus]|uniref:RHO1 GDP-GTP exchange protein 2 n=1 Tax=Monascus purpureus TaxID=5098 RepID=A0A507QUZ2_MONPU|nr:hypothetical protein MPDQ_008100 [Monascus purpureus]
MSQYQNGQQAFYSQYPHAQQGAQQLRRASSFDAGDDAQPLDGLHSRNANARDWNSRYSLHGNAPSSGGYDDDLVSMYSHLSSSSSTNAIPNRTPTHVAYLHQNATPTSPSQPIYNPQQFAASLSQAQPATYNPLAYSASVRSPPQHQTYNPTAYQSTSTLGYGPAGVRQRPSAASQYGYSPTSPTTAQNPYSSTPEQSYGFPQQTASPAVPPAGTLPYPDYAPRSPMRAAAGFNVSSAVDEQPPEPPAHLTPTEGPYSGRLSGSWSTARRSLPSLPPQQSLPVRTDILNRHPHARPLPGPPPEAEASLQPSPRPTEEQSSEELMEELEAAMTNGRHGSTHSDGIMAMGTGQCINYDVYSDESDAEAAAGLAMMKLADEEDRRRAEAVSSVPAAGASPYTDFSSDDGVVADLSLYSGGYDAHLHYGNEPDLGRTSDLADNSLHTSNWSADDRTPSADGYMSWGSGQHFPEYPSDTRVDAAGTGGLAEPDSLGRRLSFDYGDEVDGPLATTPGDPSRSDSDGADKEEHRDFFFHPGMQPLPPVPVEPVNNPNLRRNLMPAGTYRHQEQDGEFAQYLHQTFYPLSPDSFGQTVPGSTFPRSTSVTSPPHGPRADTPIRSKTDADREKHKSQQDLLLQRGLDAQANSMGLDLPTIPAKKFTPSKLSSEQFRKCTEPWALSAIVAWVRELSEDETDLRRSTIVEAFVSLFTHKVPTMNVADAETLAAKVVMDMLNEQVLVKEEEWVKFGPGTLSGVLFQITGTGCYSSRLHMQETEVFGRCYSHHCMRTLKKVNLKAQVLGPEKKAEDWVTFYKIPKEVWSSYPKKEIDLQNNLHEIVTTEDLYIGQLDVLRKLYRDQLANMQPPIITPKRLDRFLKDVFGKVDAVKKVNEDFLLAQLKYRQKEQGPFIVGFSDIFREWIRKAKAAYISYAETFPNANYLVRKEAERNLHFREFLNRVRDDKLSNRLGWDTYLKAPITRIQRYTLLLATVQKNMVKDSEEKANVEQAIKEIKIVALECDNKVGEMTKKVDLLELSQKLQLRPEMKNQVELNLEHLGREIIFRSDLQRQGTTRFNIVDAHAILFDHYLVLAKASTSKMGKYSGYDVSKMPIPMDLLVLESTNDDPVVKSAVRGIATVGGSAALPQAGNGNQTSSNGTVGPTTTLENSSDKVLYPFKIKHLGKSSTYTLYAFSAQNRQDWCQKIIEAKTRHARALFAQNAEPFRLRVLADTAFAYTESQAPRSVVIEGTPIDRAIRDVEERYRSRSKPRPVCRNEVNCSTVFQQSSGRLICAVGTDSGVYMSAYDDPRGWFRAIPFGRVTQLAVFEEFNLLLLIADKSLFSYQLDAVLSANGGPLPASNGSSRRAPQKLSGGREVGFFAVGRLKDRTLVLYKKRDGLSSTFKVLEPVLQKSASTRSRFFPSRRGNTDYFREYDEFYIPAESYAVNLFHTTLAISTHRGVEVLTLDKKQPWSVPLLRSDAPEAQAYLSSIAGRIKDLRPLGMFRLSESEFLVTYTECAVYVNQHGDVSRSVVMEFVGKAQTACLYGKFLVLFNEDFVEVRNAMNGRLRQVIPGRNVVCLDTGGSFPASSSGISANGIAHAGSTGHTVKFSMQHPEDEKSQILLELIENDGQTD